MFRAIKMVAFGLVSIGMCWFPVAVALVDTFRRDVRFTAKVKEQWGLWWETLDDVVG